jgi:hypothetical protein
MKVIDRTPFRGPDGKISALDRVRATMKYGSSWYADVQAQAAAASVLGRHLDRTFTLLLNPQLPESDVILPMVLVGPPGVFMVYSTNERGVFQARGEEWGTLSGEQFVPAKVNLLARAGRMAQALGKFLGKQGLPIQVEPVLLTMNPGMHVDSVRPTVRVVMTDGLEHFAIGLTQGDRPLSPEDAGIVADRIIKPRLLKSPAETASASAAAGGGALPNPAPQAEVQPQAVAVKAPKRGGIRFSRGQWFALGCLFLVFVLILVTIIVLAVMNA